MKSRILITVIIVTFLSSISKSQDLKYYENQKDNAKKGYIITKDKEYQQVFIFEGIDKDNSDFVIYINDKKAPVQKYSKYEISEYGYEDVVYEAIKHKGDVVFMRRMNKKEPFMYYYNNSNSREFYLKKNDKLELLPKSKNELRNTLNNEFANCEFTETITKLASYNKNRLNNIINRLENCDNHKISYFKIGIMGGLRSHNIIMEKGIFESQRELEKVSMNLPYFGLFVDIPMSQNNQHFTFHPELEFLNAKQYEINTESSDLTFDINYTTTNLFFRYNSLRPINSLFVDFGIIYSNLKISNIEENDEINTTELIDNDLSNSIYGIGAGIGFDFTFKSRLAFNIGIRGSYLISAYKKPNVWNTGLYLSFSY